MPTAYWRAPEVQRIAEGLVEQHHGDLMAVRIEYLFRDPVASSRGRAVLGKARVIRGLPAYLVGLVGRAEIAQGVAPDFFVIEIAYQPWQTLTAEQKAALVDHELCHLGVEPHEDPGMPDKLVIRGHDVEEFTAVVARHGAWRGSVSRFVQAGEQPLFPAGQGATVVQLHAGVNPDG